MSNIWAQSNSYYIDFDLADNAVPAYVMSGKDATVEWEDILSTGLDYYEYVVVAPGSKTYTAKVLQHITSFTYYAPCVDVLTPLSTTLSAYKVTARWPRRDKVERMGTVARTVKYFTGNPLVENIGVTQCNDEPFTVCFPDSVTIKPDGVNNQKWPEWRKFTWYSIEKGENVGVGLCHTTQEDEYSDYGGIKAAAYTVTVEFEGDASKGDNCFPRPQVVSVVVVDLSEFTQLGFSQGCEVKDDTELGTAVQCEIPGSFCVLPKAVFPVPLQALQITQTWEHIDKTTNNRDMNHMTYDPVKDITKVCYSDVDPEDFEDYEFKQSIKGDLTIENVKVKVKCDGVNTYRVRKAPKYSKICDVATVDPTKAGQGGGTIGNEVLLRGDEDETNPSLYTYRWSPTEGLQQPTNRNTKFVADSDYCGKRTYSLYKASVASPLVEQIVYCVDIIGPWCTAVIKHLFKTGEEDPLVILNIYPNPSQNQVNLDLTADVKHAVIQVISLDGKVILQENRNLFLGANTLDISALKNGSYFIQVLSGNNRMVKPLMIVK